MPQHKAHEPRDHGPRPHGRASRILLIVEVGIDHAAFSILPRAMQVMAIREVIEQQGGRCALTDQGRAVLRIRHMGWRKVDVCRKDSALRVPPGGQRCGQQAHSGRTSVIAAMLVTHAQCQRHRRARRIGRV